MDPISQIDAVLRLVDRELWVVTAKSGPRRGGLLATWVASASIDRQRPVLLAGIAPNHFTAELVQASGAFAAHLLRLDQVETAWNFARGSGRERDKLAGLETRVAATGSPVLADCLACCDCRVFACYDAGDRLYFWADVVEAQSGPLAPREGIPRAERADSGGTDCQPLREHALFAALSPEQRKLLIADRDADVALQRPLNEAWRKGGVRAGARATEP